MKPVPVDGALQALAHPARRGLVSVCGDRERTVGELSRLAGLRQPAASQHLRVLRDAGLMTVRADGNRRFYRVDFERLAAIQAALDDLWGRRLPDLKHVAETRGRSRVRRAG